jgi:deazaflavin-dependent oxidoreductase (nitroreductase family)
VGLRQAPFIWRLMKVISRRMVKSYGATSPVKNVVLLLTTTGRKSGLPRTTPLQYEEVGGAYVVGSARGVDADWYRNLVADPQVEIQVGGVRYAATAQPIADPRQIADFLALRLERHPIMVGAMMMLEGLPPHPTRAQLEAHACQIAIVRLCPQTTLTPADTS